MEFPVGMKLDWQKLFETLIRDADVDRYSRWYIRKRIRAEGISFVTKTLPKFAKAVLKSIDSGRFVSRSELSNFSWKGRLPRLFRRLTLSIFDNNGVLRHDPDPAGLWVLRQVCEYAYKLSLPFDDKVLGDSESEFISTDDDIAAPSSSKQLEFIEKVRKNVESQYRFPTVDEVLNRYRPRYGPGSFSSSSRVESWNSYKSTEGVGTSLPGWARGISGFFKSYPSSPERVVIRGKDTSDYSELLFVPKDSRGPRVIIREPLHLLRLQLSFFDWMVDFCEQQTCKRINFRDQQINRDLARLGSITGEWATLDLKEASDRVDVRVVRRLFRNIPVLRYFTSKRSTHTRLPSGKLRKLNKLAGMGSGLTFATMAFIIHVTVATALSRYFGGYAEAAKHVYVYGDDIIVPTHYASIAAEALALVGLKVNTDKSFTSYGPGFRESCGGDYFMGNEVQPIRLRLSSGVELLDGGFLRYKDGPAGLIQVERHCRELVSAGFLQTAEFLYQQIEKYTGPLPEGSGDTPALCRWDRHRTTPLQETETGMYGKVRAFLPYSKGRLVQSPNPYFFLGKYLSRQSTSVLETLVDPGLCWSGVSITKNGDAIQYHQSVDLPRQVGLRLRRVSVFNLNR